MKESLLVEDGCFVGCLEDEIENGSFRHANHQASHAAQSGNFGKYHVIQELQIHWSFSFECPLRVKDFDFHH